MGRLIRIRRDELLWLHAAYIDWQARLLMRRRRTAKARSGEATGDMDCASAVGGPQQKTDPDVAALRRALADGRHIRGKS